MADINPRVDIAFKKIFGIELNFTSILESTKYHNIFHITEKDSGFKYFKDLELHTIELKKFSNNEPAELFDIMAKITNSLEYVGSLPH